MLTKTLSRALDQNADSVVVTNRDGVIQYVNPAFERITGYAREEAVGNTPRLIRSGVATQQFYETLWSTILSGRAFHMTITNRRQDGRLWEQEQTITPLCDERGTVTHFISTGRDVTERTQSAAAKLQRQLELEGARIASLLHDEAGQFLALAHIALAGVAKGLGPVEAARVQEVRGYLEYVEERLRDAARGVQPRLLAGFSLADAIRYQARECERQTGIPVIVESSLGGGYSPAVETVIYRFVQEALSNVVKHAHAASVTIHLDRHVGGRRASDITVFCSVRDDGAGFDVRSLKRRSNRRGGIEAMQARVKAVGGAVAVVSARGQGTELRLTVPVEDPAARVAADPTRGAP